MTTLLMIVTIILIIAGGFAIIMIIGTAIILIYYLLIYFAIRKLEKSNQIKGAIPYFFWILFLIPIAWAIYDIEGFVNFLLQGVSLDMK